MLVILTKCKALVTRTKLKVKIECSFLKVIITIAIDEQLNELATIRVARVKIAI